MGLMKMKDRVFKAGRGRKEIQPHGGDFIVNLDSSSLLLI